MNQATRSVGPERHAHKRCDQKLLLALLFAGRAFAIQFPPDAGMIDVTLAPYNAPHYAAAGGSCAAGAVGAGDATAAIQSAIWAAANVNLAARILYLPNGCYKVSNTLWWQQYNDGETPTSAGGSAFIQMHGQSQSGAVLYVPPSSSNFQSASNCAAGTYQGWVSGTTGCRAVLYTCQGYSVTQVAYCPGNNAYMNNIHDLSIEIGTGNPGAIGISLIENNSGGIRNVTIKSDDSSPLYGLEIARQLNGPGIVENLMVTGFKYGILVGTGGQIAPINGITFNHIFLSGQSLGGIAAYNQQLWMRDLNYVGPNPALQANNFTRITLVTGSLAGGGGGVSAIQANGTGGVFFLRGITCGGFASCMNYNGSIVAGNSISEYTSSPVVTQFPSSVGASLNLPVTGTPTYTDTNFAADWANVKNYGATGGCGHDDTAGIQAAMNSGKPVVYFPFDCYRVDGNPNPVSIPATVRLIEGMGSCIGAQGNNCVSGGNFSNERTPFTSSANGNTIFEDFYIDKYDVGCMSYTGAGSFTMTDVFNLTCFQGNSPGNIFTDDSAITGISVTGGGHFFCLQCNVETHGNHIEVNNETAWILGFKTEGDSISSGCTNTTCGMLYAHNNAVAEVLGAWFYGTQGAAFLMQNSQVSIANPAVPNSYSPCFSESHNSGTPATLPCNSSWDGNDATSLYSGNTYTTGIPVGSLTGSVTTSSAAVNLTTEGTTDWIHWGDTAVNRKSGVTPQLSNYTVVGASPVIHSNDPRPESWTDGTPTASATNDFNEVFTYTVGNGFSVTAPADTTSRKLILHVGGWNSAGKLTAHLSDGSAVDYTNTATGSAGQYDGNYTLIYNAASAGQTLTVTWIIASGTTGHLSLDAAALTTNAAGSLTGSVTTASAAVNLTTEGTTDWIHWGDTAVNRKSGVTPQLSTYTIIGTAPAILSTDLRRVSWTDGTPTPIASSDTNDVFVYGIGDGFSFTAPADTTTRKLVVHVSGWNGAGTLTAHLSDESAADYTDTAAGSAGHYDGNYTLTYTAGSPGQTLTVTWTLTSGTTGHVGVQAAALQ